MANLTLATRVFLRVLVALFVAQGVFWVLLSLPAIHQSGGWPLLIGCVAIPIAICSILLSLPPVATKIGIKGIAEAWLNAAIFAVIWLPGMFGLPIWIGLHHGALAGLGAAYIAILVPAVLAPAWNRDAAS